MSRQEVSAIASRGVTKRFARTVALRGIDLDVMPGERVALFGANGSGKTTLLKIMAGLLRPTKGRVAIHGIGYQRGGPDVRRRIGVLGHHTFLYDDLSGEENLLFFGRMFETPDLHRRVRLALETVGMEHRRKDKVRTLSRGMQQRLALARATLHDPDILLLDEPDTGLDPTAAAQLQMVLERTSGPPRTIVLATHDIALGMARADRYVLLSDGRITRTGTIAGTSASELASMYTSYASTS